MFFYEDEFRRYSFVAAGAVLCSLGCVALFTVVSLFSSMNTMSFSEQQSQSVVFNFDSEIDDISKSLVVENLLADAELDLIADDLATVEPAAGLEDMTAPAADETEIFIHKTATPAIEAEQLIIR